jgi:DNA helicase-2/ATP-dependent DNA helicase PcrA
MELAKRGVDYLVRGGVRFFEQAHVKDVLAFLRVVANPLDEIAWIRVLRLQPGIGLGYADRIFQKVVEASGNLVEISKEAFGEGLPPRERQGLGAFKAVLKPLIEPRRRERPEMLLEEVLDRGYSKHVLLNFENARDRLEDLRQLVNFAHSYKGLKEFLADVMLREGFRGESLEPGSGQEAAEAPLVLSTIHQAKGLEWKAVFVIGLSEGLFPHAKSLESSEQLEEERRLFYVACTRAKDLLFLTQPMMRYDSQAGMIISRPSLFTAELPRELYEEVEVEERPSADTIYVDEDLHDRD